MNTVGKELMLHELYERVETAVYENYPNQARGIMVELCEWPMGFSRNTRQFGSVRLSKDQSRRVLKMSSFAMSSAAYDDTLLHEVAHIIAWIIADDRSHGFFWRSVARAIGADPTRLGTDVRFDEAIAAHRVRKTKLVAECPKCGKTWHRQRRLRKAGMYECPNCKVTVIKH